MALKTWNEWRNESKFEPNEDSISQNHTPQYIDITVEEWQKIKGVGPKLAQKLFENGPYEDISEIKKIRGVSDNLYQKIVEVVI